MTDMQLACGSLAGEDAASGIDESTAGASCGIGEDTLISGCIHLANKPPAEDMSQGTHGKANQ